MSDKIIFLDIDGVLNSSEWAIYMQDVLRSTNTRYHVFDPLCVKRLNYIIEKTDAKLVLSSSWRSLYKNKDELNAIFNRQNIPSVIDYTSKTISPPRGREIKKWLSDNKNVTNFIILDDDSDMEDLCYRLVKCNHEKGLQDEQMNMAIKMLNETFTFASLSVY